MSTPGAQSPELHATHERALRALYQQLLDSWNARRADTFAELFTEAGHVVGFDGSTVNGNAAIQAHLHQIFSDHQTGAYVGIVREVRALSADVAILRAVVGMIPPGQSDINPAVNAIQTLVAARHDPSWRIELFQTTPAQFHGRPELVEQLTAELQQQRSSEIRSGTRA